MPHNYPTLADLVADRFQLADDLASDLLNDAPFLRMLPMVEASDGTVDRYPKKVGEPVVGFRTVSTGRDMSKGSTIEMVAALALLDWTSELPTAQAHANRKLSPMQHVMDHALEHLAAALSAYEKQVFNGKIAGDAVGFDGFLDTETLGNSDSEMVVNAGGTAVGAATSVYAVRLGDGAVKGVRKGYGEAFEVGETVVSKIDDGTGKTLPGYYTPGEAWLGLRMGSKFSVGRICNITDQDNHRLDDQLISKLLAKFPAGKGATHLVMNRDAQQMLQASRTATNPTGAPAPFPETAYKLPITTTDSITSTEPLAVAA